MTVTITITVEGHFRLLAAPFEAKECPEQPPESPNPSHPGWGMGLWHNNGWQSLRSSVVWQLAAALHTNHFSCLILIFLNPWARQGPCLASTAMRRPGQGWPQFFAQAHHVRRQRVIVQFQWSSSRGAQKRSIVSEWCCSGPLSTQRPAKPCAWSPSCLPHLLLALLATG